MTNSSQYSTDTAQEDIVTRIREEAKKQTTLGQAFDMLHVADEIERLRAELDLVGLAKVQSTGVYEAALATRKAEVESLRELNDDLAARIDWLITTFSSYDEDGLFAFPDGAHWGKPRG